jgi:hypothetical protein
MFCAFLSFLLSSSHFLSHVLGRRMPPQEYIARLSDLKERDVYQLIQDHFYDVDPVVVGFGPLEEFPDYALMRSWTYCMIRLESEFYLFIYVLIYLDTILQSV